MREKDEIIEALNKVKKEFDAVCTEPPVHVYLSTAAIEHMLECKVVSTHWMDEHWPDFELPSRRALQVLPDGSRVFIVGDDD